MSETLKNDGQEVVHTGWEELMRMGARRISDDTLKLKGEYYKSYEMAEDDAGNEETISFTKISKEQAKAEKKAEHQRRVQEARERVMRAFGK